MVTKNEMVAILTALTTDFDAPENQFPAEAVDDQEKEVRHMEHKEPFVEQHRRAS